MKRTVVSVSRADKQRRIETFHVSDLELQSAFVGQLREQRRLGARARHRLFDEHVHAVLEKEAGQREMLGRRRRDRDRVDFADELAMILQRLRADLCGHRAAALRIAVANATSSTPSSARCFCA